MQVQLEMKFAELLKIVNSLPEGQLELLKAEIKIGTKWKKSMPDLETLLLNGPTATKKQLEIIEKNRKAINKTALSIEEALYTL